MSGDLFLRGLDGANPLAFLATLGVFALTDRIYPGAKLFWQPSGNGVRPILRGAGNDENAFVSELHKALIESSANPFSIDKRLPFSAGAFRKALERSADETTPKDRRDADLMAALGTEIHLDDKGSFMDTAFRMVRSGDAAGQGLPAYAISIRSHIELTDLDRTIFKSGTITTTNSVCAGTHWRISDTLCAGMTPAPSPTRSTVSERCGAPTCWHWKGYH